MTPYEKAAAEHARQAGPRSFTEDVEAHMLNGFVFSTPTFFIMGRGVNRMGEPALIVNPWHAFPRSGWDCWHVYLMAGDVGAAWAILPWPLPWLSWERQRGQELELCFYRADAIRRLSPPPPP